MRAIHSMTPWIPAAGGAVLLDLSTSGRGYSYVIKSRGSGQIRRSEFRFVFFSSGVCFFVLFAVLALKLEGSS